MITIYLITNSINDKKYVGQTIKTIQERWARHCWTCNLKANRMPITEAISKYRKENFKIEKIDEAESLEEANQKEIHWANYYNTFSPNGYNLKAGGRKYLHMSEETKQKLRIAMTGRKATEETRRKSSESHKGFKVTDETKKKLSEINKGKPTHENTIRAAKEKSCKKYKFLSPEGEEVIIINMAKFCRDNNLWESNMNEVAKGKKLQYKGWKCLENYGFMYNELGSRRHPLIENS